MTSFSGLAGVGLLITPTCPIRDLHDVTSRYVSSALLLSRYVLVAGTLDSIRTYIHVIYAPASPEHRPQFFSALPRHFEDDAHHIVMGDFNTVLSTQLDQARSTNRARLQGRDELLSWMSALRLVVPWRLQHPDIQEFTGPTRASRIKYLFVNYGLFRSVFNTVSHDFKAQSGTGDHIGLSFRLDSTTFTPPGRAPWKCPSWVIHFPEAKKYLRTSLFRLAASFNPTLRRSNPGCLLDEHKRQDSIFLRGLFLVKKNALLRAIEDLHLTVNRLHHRQALDPTVDLSSAIASAQATLSVKLLESVQVASRRKFASDIQATERCSRFFFDPPKFSTNHLSLWTRRTL